MDEARKLIAQDRPSLVILEHDPPRIDGMATCRAIRQQCNGHEHQLPVVMVAAQEDPAPGAMAGVTDWLIKPFTGAYARTKICAWVLRTTCQWMRGSFLPMKNVAWLGRLSGRRPSLKREPKKGVSRRM
jgi:DNA-binding response OmpR family regulator